MTYASRASGFRVPLEATYYCYRFSASSLSAGADATSPTASLFLPKNPKAPAAKATSNLTNKGGKRTRRKSLWHSFNIPPLVHPLIHGLHTPPSALSPLFSSSSLSNVHFFCLMHSFLFHRTLSFCVTRSALVRCLCPPLSKPPISSSFPQTPSLIVRKKSQPTHR